MNIKSTRLIVLELLNKMDQGAFSNLALDSMLNGTDFSERDKAFISRLFYGILERKITLEYIISVYSSKPLSKLDQIIVNVLEIGLYQIMYMDSVPDNAAVNETVNLTKQVKKASAAGFVNALLRNFIRDGKIIKYPENKIQRLSVEYSCNIQLVDKLCLYYSYDCIKNFLKSSLEPHKTFIRVNTLKNSTIELIEKLHVIGINAEKSEFVSDCLYVDKINNLESCELFTEGCFHIQDLSSQLCCKMLDPQSNDIVIDICAAPGGKTITIAELMNNQGRIIAADLHEKRVKLIDKHAKCYGIDIIETMQNDAKFFNPKFPLADKILCDVPCSGLGVIRSKPELKYINLEKINNLPDIQYKILSTASRYLKKGGELVYSTCTVNKAENDEIIDKFLYEHQNFIPVEIMNSYSGFSGYKATIFPEHFDCEGFFISKIRKVD